MSTLTKATLAGRSALRGKSDHFWPHDETRVAPASPNLRRAHHSTLALLLAADVLALAGSYALLDLLPGFQDGPGGMFSARGGVLFAVMLPLWLAAAACNGLYSRDTERPDHSTLDDFGRTLTSATFGAWIYMAAAWVILDQPIDPAGLVAIWAASVVFLLLGRTAARVVLRRRTTFMQNVVVVGAGDVGQMVAEKLVRRFAPRLNLVGFIDDDPRPRPADLRHVSILGGVEELPGIIETLDVDRVVVAFSRIEHERMVGLLRSLKGSEVQVDIVPRFFEGYGTKVGVHTIEGLPLVCLPPLRPSRLSRGAKRAMDLVLAGGALAVLAPVFGLIALLIKRNSPGPVLYKHERVGQGGRPISVYKFRTMYLEYCRGDRYGGESAERAFERIMSDPDRRLEFERSFKLERDPRVTSMGQFLRRTSLDELPQLLNVLRGELSLVGPRPVTEAELIRYGSDADAMVDLRPGLTGYWQVTGRSMVSYDERVRLDMAYMMGWSLSGDISILARTAGKLLSARSGAF